MVLAMLAAFGAMAQEPALRFGFLTDTHINADGSNLDRVQKALTLFKTNGVDLVVHGGDLCSAFYPVGYVAYSNCFETVFAGAEPVPRKIYAVGNHDTQDNLLGGTNQITAAAEALRILGAENLHTDKRTVNGYTFLVMPYALGDTGQGFLSWEEYESAVSNACEEAGAGMPVFVLEHKPPQDTVYNTASIWGYQQSKQILSKYPQVVELSGHVHGSLRNDVFFWQGAFSVVNACCLQQWFGLLDGQSDTTAKDSNGVLLVDVFADKIVIARWDVLDGTEIDPEHRWQINLPHAEATAAFNRTNLVAAEQANPPAFGEGAELAVAAVTSGSDTTGYKLTFPQVATNAMTYWIEVQRQIGGSWTPVAHSEIFSDYWKAPSERSATATYTFPTGELDVNTTYRFAVQPVGQYGAKGAAITAEVTTPSTLITPDFFVDYVQATGGQYIDTQVIGRSGTKAEIDISIAPSDIGNDRAVLDARKDGTNSRFYFFHTSDGFAAYGYGTYKRQDHFGTLKGDYRYFVESELRAGLQKLALNGQTVATQSDATAYDTGANLYLFACNYATMSTPQWPIKAKCYGLKIWQTDAYGDYQLARDFRPCVKAGVGGLYDTVSKRIFYGNKVNSYEPAALTLPADWTKWGTAVPGKPDYFVEYVESNGRQALDTGVRARTGVKAEADIRWMNYNGEQTFLGAATGTSSFYMMHYVTWLKMWVGYGATRTYFNDPGTGSTALWAPDAYNKVTVDFSAGAQSITRNGTNVWSFASEEAVDLNCTVTAFAVRRFGWPYYWSRVRCKGLKMWLDGTLVRDFRPCMKGGRPGLYDTVNDEVCFPAGEDFSGAGGPLNAEGFAGHFVDYVAATGAQYVDLGVRGRSGTKVEKANARCYSLKIWQTPTTNAGDTAYALVRDLVPCAYHDGKNVMGALFDRVTGEILLGNERLALPSPAHVVSGKPDAFVAYIESNGSQLLDTGVKAATGVKVEGEFMWLEGLAESTYLGMYSGTRMYMIHKVGTLQSESVDERRPRARLPAVRERREGRPLRFRERRNGVP